MKEAAFFGALAGALAIACAACAQTAQDPPAAGLQTAEIASADPNAVGLGYTPSSDQQQNTLNATQENVADECIVPTLTNRLKAPFGWIAYKARDLVGEPEAPPRQFCQTLDD